MTDGNVAALQDIDTVGWRAGLSTLMGAGFGAWWKTKDWRIQALLWTAIINGSVAAVVWSDAPNEIDVFGLYGIMTMFGAAAVTITMQEAIVGEKRSGTAAWVLSKPVSRQAFMLSKLVPNAVSVVATMIAIPTAFLYL
jgi:ABC-2 type transport system permease protein